MLKIFAIGCHLETHRPMDEVQIQVRQSQFLQRDVQTQQKLFLAVVRVPGLGKNINVTNDERFHSLTQFI